MTKRLHDRRRVGSLQVLYTPMPEYYDILYILYNTIILLYCCGFLYVRPYLFFVLYIYIRLLYKIEKKLTIITCWTNRIRATIVESYDPATNRIHIIKPSIYTRRIHWISDETQPRRMRQWRLIYLSRCACGDGRNYLCVCNNAIELKVLLNTCMHVCANVCD